MVTVKHILDWAHWGLFAMLYAIWYHLYSLKNVENNHGGVILLVKLQVWACSFTKYHSSMVVFTYFELHKWYQIAQASHLIFDLLDRMLIWDGCYSLMMDGGRRSYLIRIQENVISKGGFRWTRPWQINFSVMYVYVLLFYFTLFYH